MAPLNAKFTPVVKSLLEEYVAKKRDQRAAIVTSAVQQITSIAEKEGLQVPDLIAKVWLTLSIPICSL
jgi:hypothetical protein